MPVAYSGKIASREHILAHGIGNLQVPFDMGSFRKLKERAEGAKHATYSVDVVFNPFIVQLFMEDEFCTAMSQYRPFVIGLALKRVEESIGTKLSTQEVKLVKSLRYKDPDDADARLAREFAELKGEADSFDEEAPKQPQAVEPPVIEPLIQDVTPGKKPAIKKGFLNQASKQLYGPEGSGEGVLPENAGDPMGWMPKKLRQSSKIVDCNSPEWQEHEKKKKAVDSQNAMNKEFRDTISNDMASWCKVKEQDKWEPDLPEGTEPAASQKYDVDYSRFDQIDDVEDFTATTEQRDWYYDEKGNSRQIEKNRAVDQTTEQVAQQTGSEEAPKSQLQRGFLNNAKAAFYPNGSEQAKAPPCDEQLLHDFGNLLCESEPESAAQAPEKKSSVTVKVPDRKAPEFELNQVPEGLSLAVSVPGLTSMQGVSLDVTEREVSLEFPPSVNLKPLKVELAESVIPTGARAKFSRKTKQISISLPVAAAGG